MAAVAADDAAVPATEMIIPLRRPNRSTTGPTPSTTIAVPTLTNVETSRAWLVLQPNASLIRGSRVPKRMKSYTAMVHAKNAMLVARRVSRTLTRRSGVVVPEGGSDEVVIDRSPHAFAVRGRRARKSSAMASKVVQVTPSWPLMCSIRRSSINSTCGRPDTSGWMVNVNTA